MVVFDFFAYEQATHERLNTRSFLLLQAICTRSTEYLNSILCFIGVFTLYRSRKLFSFWAEQWRNCHEGTTTKRGKAWKLSRPRFDLGTSQKLRNYNRYTATFHT